MTAHRYWRLMDMATADGAGYVAGAECYLRQTVGGTNEIPVASTSSAYYADPPAVLYDGNPLSWWASLAVPRFVAFDYGAAITPVEMLWRNRPDYVPQGLMGCTLQWSDTGLSGPWVDYADVTFSTWSAAGEVQTAAITFIPGERISEQTAYVPLAAPPGEGVSEQSAYAVLGGPPGMALSEQTAYVVLVASSGPPPPTPVVRRRQYTLM